MRKNELAHLREMLLKKRQEIVDNLSHLEADWQQLGERDAEMEEEAQKADMVSIISQLDDWDNAEIAEIDLALYKMTRGDYGVCEGCKKLISCKRMEAILTTRLCVKCAHMYEKVHKKLPEPREIISAEELPVEYQDLDDKELRGLILEHFRNDGRVDVEELKIYCRRGVVYLKGLIPNQNERQIILQILTDVFGLRSIIDYLTTDERIWENEKRTPSRVNLEITEKERSVYSMEVITDDLIESEEEEIPYTLPDRPVQEKE